MLSFCGNPADHDGHDWPAPTGDQAAGYVWHCPGVHHHPFATLLYQWDELEQLSILVDEKLSEGYLRNTPRWMVLNSLRTSLREAQYQVRPTGTPSPMLQVITELLQLQRWKAEATAVIVSWERAYAAMEEAGLNPRVGVSMADTVVEFVQRVLAGGSEP